MKKGSFFTWEHVDFNTEKTYLFVGWTYSRPLQDGRFPSEDSLSRYDFILRGHNQRVTLPSNIFAFGAFILRLRRRFYGFRHNISRPATFWVVDEVYRRKMAEALN